MIAEVFFFCVYEGPSWPKADLGEMMVFASEMESDGAGAASAFFF